MAEGPAKVIKYALFVANIVIFVCGISAFAVGVWTSVDRSYMQRLFGTHLYRSSASLLIATGIIVTVISFLGCFGAQKEIKCMLLTFFIILIIIFIVMLVGGIMGYVFRDKVEEGMHKEMVATVSHYKNDTGVTDAWDAIQKNFKCCGIKTKGYDQGYTIWARLNPWEFNKDKQVPKSCCRKQDNSTIRSCQARPDNSTTYMDDCYEKMIGFVKNHALILGGIGIGTSCVLLLGIILSCALFLMID